MDITLIEVKRLYFNNQALSARMNGVKSQRRKPMANHINRH